MPDFDIFTKNTIIDIMIKTVFFDINDTLINHSLAQRVAIRKMSTLLPKQKQTEFTKIWRKTARRYWKLFEKGKITFEEQRIQRIASVWNSFKTKLTPQQLNQYANYYATCYEQALILNSTLKTFLELLQTNHIPTGIISNGYGPLQRSRLRAIGIESYLTNRLIFISEEIGIGKPDKKIFILAETTAGVHHSDILFFGDDLENDIKPAQERGWKTVLITSHYKFPALVDLKKLLNA